MVSNEAVVKKSQKQIAQELKRSKANAAVNSGHLVGKLMKLKNLKVQSKNSSKSKHQRRAKGTASRCDSQKTVTTQVTFKTSIRTGIV